MIPDPVRGPVVQQIFAWRIAERLGYAAIADRLNADRDRYPPPVHIDPQRRRDAWGRSSVREILVNPKYTGYMVWNRRGTKKGGVVNHPDTWVWSPEPVHPPLVSQADFLAAAAVGPERFASRSGNGAHTYPATHGRARRPT
ncbi:recombinase family protein, partial [Candidatus Protofrankia californiensis]|uniref:recombinase family protein n=1 Tax=Candidatus Protofrankia californiensis TaxID=1839754 RepID=UPI0019D082AB